MGDCLVPDSNAAAASILIVDDTPTNLALMVELLQPHYRTRVALNGEKAIALALGTEPPDLILLDVMMPGLSGYDVCRRIKADPRTRDIPIIFLSAMGAVEDETLGLQLGGVDYVTKPIRPAIVLARIRTHLAMARQSRERERLVTRLEQQTSALSELNHTLEQRIADGVAQVERLGRLKRYFSPSVVDLMLSSGTDNLIGFTQRVFRIGAQQSLCTS
ncbi:MAG: response regulator [Rhodoferax sp.]|nr:response regulator [Rhodoferax sp.]